MIEIGSTTRNSWQVSGEAASLVRQERPARPVHLKAEPQSVVLDAARTALIVIDMQNFFCAEDGKSEKASRRPIKPLQDLLPAVREADVPVIWVNWGTRPDRLNLSPSVQYTFRKSTDDEGPAASGISQLFKGSEVAKIIPELEVRETDIHVDKHRLSGFWDTPLDSILRNLAINTLLFAGVNMDQCVLATLQDASFLGYDCIMLEDCVATGSPDFCREATLYNVKKCFGFVGQSASLIEGLTEGLA